MSYVGWAPSRAARAVKGVVLGLCCLVVIGPFIMVIATSFADAEQIGRGGGLVLFPSNPNLDAYRAILGGGQVTRALLVSIGITVVGTSLSLLVTTILAYALSRRDLLFGKTILMLILLTMLFSPGMIPLYLTVKEFGLLNSWWSLILPVLVSAFNTIVMRAFFMQLPNELTEAAVIDGAADWRIFLSIILPLSKPVLAAIGLFYAVSYWNVFFSALLYLNDSSMWPIQLVMRQYIVNGSALGVNELDIAGEVPPPQPALQMAILVLALIPIAIVYPFLQKHFTKGVLTGAVKG
ncbi:MAG TPA: carbohydrate ABC transporter permease [Actinopolymorphaceae bacterium]